MVNVDERPWDHAWLWDYRVLQLDTPQNATDSNPFYRAHQAWLKAGSPPLPDYDVDLSLLTIGDGIALVTNPAEFFVELGQEVRRGSPYPHTLISTLTNGNAGYVPTRRAFAEGGYEVKKYPAKSFLTIEAGERIVAESIRLLQALR